VRWIHALAAAAAIAGCGGGSASGDDVCQDTAVLTWDNFGEGFLVTNCQGCHASTAADRHDAPADVTFDTRDEALARADRILARTTSDPPTMPPGGGVSDEDRHKVTVWLTCFETGK
jgi:uncharacterized membrane protein